MPHSPPLILDAPIALYEPPANSLLKWIGNKQRFAASIAAAFPRRFGTYIEPFIGSGAVLATVAPREGIAGDTYAPLMEIWTALRENPTMLKRWYADRWQAYHTGDPRERYEELKSAFNARPNGADFVFLCRACYGGVVRFRKADGYMSTPRGPHKPIAPVRFNSRVEEWSSRVQTTTFLLQDYKRTLREACAGDLAYCDPPYVYTQRILYGAQSFDFRELLTEIARCKRRGVFVALSIDGQKRSGQEHLELDLPAGLFEREILLAGGPSMLKRFQSRGACLDHERVSDRLLLTY
ncbi:MAG: DNA adenine methylase [Candidatus Eremiobacteraeota bacterium]|nr:DNA adenine methylase [Candidatus Eremiobacteraeota bacterium]MBC5821949.1 DNA adenine methylase [Candidatus Eremiobacteraeota bacterium]